MPSQGISSADPHRSDFANSSMGIAGAGVDFKGVTDTRIRAALGLIGTSLRARVNASAIALRIGLSRSRFEHLFKAQTGTTFRDYLRSVRLSTAQQLLADPCMRIKEVSAQCGYAATAHLSREFKRQFGITPSEYRRSTSRQQIAH
jgi:transcriptional regulator GlxA family with amidase domain